VSAHRHHRALSLPVLVLGAVAFIAAYVLGMGRLIGGQW
jgi:hypothetical protein